MNIYDVYNWLLKFEHIIYMSAYLFLLFFFLPLQHKVALFLCPYLHAGGSSFNVKLRLYEQHVKVTRLLPPALLERLLIGCQ